MQGQILRSGRGRDDARGRVLLLTAFLALAAIIGGNTAAVAGSIVFEDNFDVAFEGWITSGSPDWYSKNPRHGTHSIQLRETESIERTVSTVCYQNITVSFYLGARKLEGADTVRALWYDGGTWNVLKAIADGDLEEDGLLHYFAYSLPASAANNANFAVRFEVNGNDSKDFGYVDDVLVQGDIIQYTLSLAGTNGLVTVNGTPQSLPWSGSFDCGSVVNLEAVPDSCHEFTGWSGDLGGALNPTTVTMDGSKSVTANFPMIQYTLSVAGTNGSVTVNGTPQSLPWSGSFNCGSVVNLEAVPDSCYEFTGWSGDLGGAVNPTSITMDGSKSVTANFAMIQYTLSLAKTGNGSVTVNGTPQSLPWSGSFNCGSVVNLEAVPDSGWDFAGWSGDVTWSGGLLTVTMDSSKNITANFSEQPTLSLTKTGNGSAKVDGTLQALPWSGQFASGTEVTLEAIPDSGWKFDGWSGDATWPGSQLIVTMDGPKTITATFSQESYTLSLVKVGSGSAKVDGTLRSLPWSGSFLSGTSVTLEAVADSGWEFDGWSGDATWPGSQLIVTMDTPKNITATFSQGSYTLSLVKVGSGSAKVNGTLRSLPWSGSFSGGTSVTLEAVADSGWKFDGWSGDETWSGSQLIVTMDTPKSITATFTQDGYVLNLSKVGSGSAKVDGTLRSLPWSGSFLSGTSVTLEAVADSGWEFDGWSGDATWSGSVLYVTMDDDKDLTANFKERDSFFLALSKTGAGTITVNGTAVSVPWSGELPRGSDVTLEAVPDEGWRFNRWSGDLAGSQNPTAITMNGDWDITAKFAEIQHALSITGVGAGAVKVNGDLHSLPWSGEFALGSQITVEAVPDSGWEFGSWSGGLSGESNPAVFVMDGDRSITATFVEPDQFQLTVKKSGSGSVKVDGVERSLPWSGPFANGAQVTVEAVAEADERFVEWSGDVTGSANPIALTMDSDKSVTAEFVCTVGPFADVPCDHWAAEAIAAVHDAGLASGYSDGCYLPNLAVTRAAMAVFLARGLAGGPEGVPAGPEEATFSDVPTDHWAFAEVEYVVSRSIARGYGDGDYHPAWQITRGQMAVFVARAVAEPTGDEGLATFDAPEAPSFSDVPASMWCYVHVEYLADLGIVTGYSDGLYRPAATVTRDQMAVYVTRAFDLLD